MKISAEDRARMIAHPEQMAEIGELKRADRDGRYLLALLSTSEPVMGNNLLSFGGKRPSFMRYKDRVFTSYRNTAAGVDLSTVKQGQCPVLRDHQWDTDRMAGVVERAWCRRGELWAVLRLGRTKTADEAWSMLEDGLPVSISAAAQSITYEQLPDLAGFQHYRILERKIIEVSLCVRGADENARIVLHGKNLDELKSSSMFKPPKPGKSANAGAWRRWSIPAARRIAERVGADAEKLAIELSGEVEDHLETLAS